MPRSQIPRSVLIQIRMDGSDELLADHEHIMSGEYVHEVRLNGRIMSETGICAATAGHFGGPVLLIAGDEFAVAETRELLGDVIVATLKTSVFATPCARP